MKLRQAEEAYYKDLINSENQNIYNLWHIFGKIINPYKSKNNINKLMYDNKTIVGDEKIANALNDHFCSVGEKLAVKFDKDNKSFRKYL